MPDVTICRMLALTLIRKLRPPITVSGWLDVVRNHGTPRRATSSLNERWR
jgi:hypothetical protein